MTMSFTVQVGDPHPDLDKIEMLIEESFCTINQIYNNWNPDSEISSLNALKAGQKRRLSAPLATFLHRVDALVAFTEGRFDPTVAPIKKKLVQGKLTAPLECVGWDKIHIEEGIFWKEHSETMLDLGGVAKGYGVDLMTEKLAEAGYRNLYVEWGGEIRTMGAHPHGRPWRVAILGGQTYELTDGAVATSGSYQQSWVIGDATYTHIIDPRTQRPLSNCPINSATVFSDTCLEADAIATACMLFMSYTD